MGYPDDRKANNLGTSRGYPPTVLAAVSSAAGGGGMATPIAAVAGKVIVVLSLSLTTTATSPGLVELKNGAGGTVLWHGVPGAACPIVEPCPAGGYLFRCSAGTLLQLVNGGTGGTGYLNLRYILEET